LEFHIKQTDLSSALWETKLLNMKKNSEGTGENIFGSSAMLIEGFEDCIKNEDDSIENILKISVQEDNKTFKFDLMPL
jgi:hypothetical protein